MFFCGFFAVKNTQKAEALTSGTSGTINSATKIGEYIDENGTSQWADLWDSTKNRINSTVFADLRKKLFGSEDFVTYITDHADADEQDSYTGATVVPASTINNGNEYGYILKLRGLDWMVVSMTLGDSNLPVLTLWLADSNGMSNYAIDNLGAGANLSQANKNLNRAMYSASGLRNTLFTGSWSSFASGNFATSYLIQPKNIPYQRNETIVGRLDSTNSQQQDLNSDFPNDALDLNQVNHWRNGTAMYTASSTYQWNNTSYAYCDWGSDYIWVPSLTEAGANNLAASTCIWKVSSQQRVAGDATTSIWMRSSSQKGRFAAYTLTGANNSIGVARYQLPDISTTAGVRPAIHLNLNAILEGAALSNPSDKGEVTYNGKGQTVNDAKKADGTSFYGDLLDNCDVEYFDEDDHTVKEPVNAGTYTATFIPKDGYYFWDKEQGKAIDTYDADFTIKPKALEVKFEIDEITQQPLASLIEGEEPLEGDTVNFRYRYFEYASESYEESEKLDESGTLDTTKLVKGKRYMVSVEFDNPNYEPKVTQPNTQTRKRLKFCGQPINVAWDEEKGNSLVYNGSEQVFLLKNSEDLQFVDIKLTTDSQNKGAIKVSTREYKATNAGKYAITLSFSKENIKKYCWGAEMGKAKYKDVDVTLEFEITPKECLVSYVELNGETWDWCLTKDDERSVNFDLPAICSGELNIMIYAQLPGTSSKLEILSAPLTVGTAMKSVGCKIITDNIGTLNKGYDLLVEEYSKTLNGNYTFKIENGGKSFIVKEPVNDGGIIWRLSTGKQVVGSMTGEAGSTNLTYDKTITYDGKPYSFTMSSGLGLTVDTTFGVNGYETVKKDTTDSLTSVTDAGTYITTVRLKDNSGSTHDYKIEWTIDKAKYDLSKIKWLDDGKLSYDEKGISVALVGIPEGLTPQYSGTLSASNVGDNGTAAVSFEVADEDNYVVPVFGDKTTYIFTSDTIEDFEWSKDWTVSARKIPVLWTVGTLILENEKKINAETISGGFNDYIEYVYYETDSKGNKLENAEALTEPEITEGKRRYYIAVAKINARYEGNYIFDTDEEEDLISPVFEVGRVLKPVQLAAKKTEYIYWGQPVAFQYTVVSGTVPTTAFKTVYYKGITKLDSAPTDPGEYSVQLSLKSDYEAGYYIDGDCLFDFKIVRATITLDWSENVKPPVLNLTANESKYVTYKYCDSLGNEVRVKDLRTGTYSVLAQIVDTSKYIFSNDTEYSGWKEFTVKSGDAITDPSTSPPQLPTTDPNNPNGGGNTGNQKTVSVWLSNYAAQVGSGATQVENSSGLPTNAFSVSYFLNGNPVSDLSAAGVYQVVISLKPEYANEWALTGTTSYTYTVFNGNGGNGSTTPNGNGTGDNPSDATFVSYLPIILSGVSLVLIIVFGVMAINNASAAKEANEKTKKLSVMSYSVSPFGLLAVVLGLSQTNWWIIAGVLMGLALLTAIAAFMLKGKKRKALLALGEEEARIAEEKEYAKVEEQRRRDNELRMMLASMQQSYQQPQPQMQQQLIDYDMLQNMITSSVSALLPAMQQMQALPPAQDPSAYMAQPDYASRAENEALRAQLAEQQELLNRILENQQNYMTSYEEEIEDDISWLGESEELISLEESYGALNDERKRAYYEIGSYIMNKPRTSQNDGRYAVLFKYRGRTVFKLCIKDDAPILYYPAGNGKAELRVSDASLLKAAKSTIDRVVADVDNRT